MILMVYKEYLQLLLHSKQGIRAHTHILSQNDFMLLYPRH